MAGLARTQRLWKGESGRLEAATLAQRYYGMKTHDFTSENHSSSLAPNLETSFVGSLAPISGRMRETSD